MSDPRTYEIPTEQDIDCESCSWTNTATDWTDLRTGAWSYEFTCSSCGHPNADHGNALDRGAADVLFVLLVTGAAMFVIGGINLLGGHWQWWPLALAGAALAYAVLVIALFMGAKQGADDND